MTIPVFIILNLVLTVALLTGILGLLLWSIVTQRRDDHVGSTLRIRRQP